MLAMLVSVGVFAFWGVLGYALLAPRDKDLTLKSLLLAPVLGMSCTFLCLYIGNRWGGPIGAFGVWLTLALGAAVALRLALSRPVAPGLDLARLAGVLTLTLLLTAWPMLSYGFEWVSVCNGDMTNYCLCAQRVHDDRYYEVPDVEQQVEGRDRARMMWFLNAVGGARGGVDQLLAWVMTLTGLTAQAAFMPLIVAFQLTLVTTTCALVAGWTDQRRVVWWTGLLMACSALTAFGTILQLLGQVPGLALLVAGSSLLLREFCGLTPRECYRQGVLLGVIGTAIALVYPEVAPFLVCAYALYLYLTRAGFEREKLPRLQVVGTAMGIVALLLNTKLPMVVRFMLFQQRSGGRLHEIELFNYFRRPSGLGSLWGLTNTYAMPSEPWLSLVIIVGLGLTLFALWAMWRLLPRMNPAAFVLCVMSGVAVWLARSGSGFGLFKLAQFVQPFLVATVCCYGLTCLKPRYGTALLSSILLLGLPGLFSTVDYGRGAALSFKSETMQLQDSSGLRLCTRLEDLFEAHPEDRWILGSTNLSLNNLISSFGRGRSLHVPAYDRWQNNLSDPAVAVAARDVDREICARFRPCSFPLRDAEGSASFFEINDLATPVDVPATDVQLLLPAWTDSVANRRFVPRNPPAPFVTFDYDRVHNCLIAQRSSLGEPWGVTIDVRPEHIGTYGVERDVALTGSRMMGLGRFALYEVLRPTETVRLGLACSATYAAHTDRTLPPAAAIGAERVPFGFVGSGAARTYSEPFHPFTVNGRNYVAFDLAMYGTPRDHEVHGLMALYGRDVADDDRRIVVHARELSLISEEEFQNLSPPQHVARFPQDLAHPDLEFSGIYEDGWLSGHSFFALQRPEQPAQLVVRGMVPGYTPDFTTDLTVRLDGREVAKQRLCPGEFEVALIVPAGQGRSRIECAFSETRHLGPNDPRPAACHLREIGFRELAPTASSASPAAVTLVGVTRDGWLTKDGVSLLLTPEMLATQSTVVLRGAFPKEAWDRIPAVTAELLQDDANPETLAAQFHVADHRYELTIPFAPRVSKTAAVVRVRFDSALTRSLSAGAKDPRQLVALAPSEIRLQPVSIAGGTTDGWITGAGLTLNVPAAALAGGSQVELCGHWETGGLAQPPAVHAELYIPGEDAETIPATLTIDQGRYTLTTTWGEREAVADAEVRIQFDSDFAFSERHPGNPDTRRLVTRLPDGGEIVR